MNENMDIRFKGPIMATENAEDFDYTHDKLEQMLYPFYHSALIQAKEFIDTCNEVLHEIDLNHRTPEAIKRDIKHEKNPMRLKQLNRELNMSYKFWRKRK